MRFPIFHPGQDPSTMDFPKGAMFLIDKPLKWTSFDVVNKLRYRLRHYLQVKKFKVGHCGTLDPLATGLLILCCGKATKGIEELTGFNKVYTGTITLGGTTPSYDLETEVDQTFETAHINPELIEKTSTQFIGDIQQLPPIFSAIKVDGERLYKKARKGEYVEIQPRTIHISDFKISAIEMPKLSFEVACSKGTYIRSLAFDFGKALDSGGHLSSLVRTKIGDYSLENAWNLEELIEVLENASSEI